MPIGTVSNPFCNDFPNPENSPVTIADQLLAKMGEIQKDSAGSDFNGEFNRALNQQVRDLGSEQFSRAGYVLFSTKRQK